MKLKQWSTLVSSEMLLIVIVTMWFLLRRFLSSYCPPSLSYPRPSVWTDILRVRMVSARLQQLSSPWAPSSGFYLNLFLEFYMLFLEKWILRNWTSSKSLLGPGPVPVVLWCVLVLLSSVIYLALQKYKIVPLHNMRIALSILPPQSVGQEWWIPYLSI